MKRKEIARISLPLAMTREVDALYAEIPPVECKGLCFGCCSPVGDIMLPFERDRIIKATGKRPNGAEDRAKRKPCNFLAEGRCTIHPIRPFICRIWGADKSLPCPHGCNGQSTLFTRDARIIHGNLMEATEEYERGSEPIRLTLERKGMK